MVSDVIPRGEGGGRLKYDGEVGVYGREGRG